MFMIYIDNVKSGCESTEIKATKIAKLRSNGKPYQIIKLTETKMPEACNDSREYKDERAIQSYGYYHGVTVRKIV